MKDGLNYEDFKEYKKNLTKMVNKFDKWLHNFLLNQGMKFIAQVKTRTPVDTGDLRNHWQLDGITTEGDDLRCWFVNSMYYADFVEYGHAKPYKSGALPGSNDWVDGFFMMTLSIDEIERNMPEEFELAFRAFLSSLGVL